MLMAQRQSRLQELLARRGMADMDSLAAVLKVSLSTVRRDLADLEQRGLVTRTHGGAIWTGGGETQARSYVFDQRLDHRAQAKQRIARAARELVGSGETILIDGGTTTWHFARELLGRDLQIVTNSLPIAQLFMNDERIELVLVGGVLYPRYGVLLGPVTEQMLGQVHARTLFLSVAGIHEGALYNQNLLLVQAEQRMMQQVQQVVLLADSSKFAQRALAQLCRLDAIHTVVTDEGIDKAHREQIQRAGCALVIADRETGDGSMHSHAAGRSDHADT
jgi:DeoR/GlpR family transcriptional regulator of sugar metabolism